MPLLCKGSKEKIDFSTVLMQSNGSQSAVHKAAGAAPGNLLRDAHSFFIIIICSEFCHTLE